ncbi:MAG: DUF2341 domain-containing protein, partial [Candidatus Thorarchaeota archaeon]
MKKRRLIVILAACIIGIFLVQPIPNSGSTTSNRHESDAIDSLSISDGEQWLPDFPYRKSHTIRGSYGAGTDYQVEIEVHSGEGIDAGNLVNVPNSKWTPSDPIRFTDNDGATLLDYWKESTTIEGATYWVKINDNLDFDVLIYIYYGNSTAPSLSDGPATFLFFDDFENGNLNRWDSFGPQWSATTSQVKHGTYAGYYDQLVSGDSISVNLTTEVSGIMIHSWYRAETLRGGSIGFYPTNHGTTEAVRAYNYKWMYYDGISRNDYGPLNQVNAIRWDRCEVGVDLLNHQMKLWVNKTYIGSAAHVYDTGGSNVTSSETIYRVYISTQLNYEHWVDDYYVRKWIASEPQHGEWGDGTSWLDDFPYRKKHTILGSSGAGENYQVRIKIHSGPGTDSGNLVNLDGLRWIPTDTVRFTGKDGVTLLDYWKESSDADSATYWVEIQDNLDFDTDIYVYYGNSTQPSLSNGTDTFLFFDDFENGNLDRWDYVGSQWSVTASDKRYGVYSAHYDGLVQSDFIISNLTSSQSGIMIHSWYKPENTIRGGKIVFYTSVNGRKEAVTSHDSYWQYWNGTAYTKYNSGVTVSSPPRWNRLELGVDLANYEMMLWVNGTFIGAADHIYDDDGNNITQTETIYSIEISNQLGYEHWADDYYVRRWTHVEPSHGEWGNEEWREEPDKAGGATWLDDWPYRRYHAINGSLGAGTNYQVRIEVHSGPGTDSGNLVNLPSSQW